MKKLYIFLTVILSIFLFTACSKATNDDVAKSPEEETSDPILYTYPLTGVETDEEPTNRAVAVMVNNHPKARPQSGLHEADIVFEILAEGDITRFLAIYQSSLPERVGPVRSAREYYFRLAESYGAIYVYHGAATFVDQMILNEGIDFLNGAQYDNDRELFIRESFRVAPHNSYMLFNETYNRAESKGYEVTTTHNPLPFLDEDETVSGENAERVKVTYFTNTTVQYEYDESTKTYKRFSDGEQSIDLETEKPIELNNIFIIETSHEVIDGEGRRAVDLESGGYGYLLQQGKMQYVEWENRNGQIIPVKDGEIIPFVKGKTWVNVIQSEPPANIEQVQVLE